jgi:hypothetical protein
MQNEYWMTQDGRVLYPKDFEDQHLLNTIKFIEQRGKHYKFEHELSMFRYPEPSGDAAQLAYEGEMIRLERMSVETWLGIYCNIYNLLKDEAIKRKLLI